MKRYSYALAAALVLAAPCWLSGAPTASTVLILVNDQCPAEDGTGTAGASVYVGQYYAQKRGVPSRNMVHLNTPCVASLSFTDFDTLVRKPVKTFLETRGLKSTVKYIVTTYGVPYIVTYTTLPAGFSQQLSLDAFLTSMYASYANMAYQTNPYAVSDAVNYKMHIRDWNNPQGWPMYLVTRLDGPSALIATGLVDKAMAAESGLALNSGYGYFDQRTGDWPDPSVSNAYNLATARGFSSTLNINYGDNNLMIHSAPNALWAWGWYSGNADWPGYQFVTGAVGAQLTSYTALNIRNAAAVGGWVPLWLSEGITATWGTTDEPWTTGYALGDNLLNHFWQGYNFAESAYLACPSVNWTMVFVGDPLYAPRIFAAGGLTPASRSSVVITPGNQQYVSGIIQATAVIPPGVQAASVQFVAAGGALGPALTSPPYSIEVDTSSVVLGPVLFWAVVTDSAGKTQASDPVPVLIYNPQQ